MFGFNTVFSYLMQGKKVRQGESWYPGVSIKVVDGQIIDNFGDDFFAGFNSSSLLADDWELVD